MTSLAITVVLLILIALITGIYFFISIEEEPKNEKKFLRRYAIFAILLFWLLGIFGLVPMENVRGPYIGFQLGFFILGVLHVWFLDIMHRWNDGEENYFRQELLYTVFFTALGAFGFILIFYLIRPLSAKIGILNKAIPTGLQARTIFNDTPLVFLLPYFLKKAYDFWKRIPVRKYKVLLFQPEIMDNPAYNARHIRSMVKFNFFISVAHSDNSNRMKIATVADRSYHLGSFFHVFVADYNRKNQTQAFRSMTHDEHGEGLFWIFYQKRDSIWWWNSKKYVNPYASVQENGIQNEEVIYAERIIGQPEDVQLGELTPPQPPQNPTGRPSITFRPPSSDPLPPGNQVNPRPSSPGIKITKRPKQP